MRPLSPAELTALRAIGSGRPVRFRYTPRGSAATVLPSQAAILEARGLVRYEPITDRYLMTDRGRELLAATPKGTR